MNNWFDWEALKHQFVYDKENPLLFNSGFFVYMFTLFVVLYYLLRNHYKARTWLFCVFSLFYFYKASGSYTVFNQQISFVVFVILAAVGDWLLSNLIYTRKKQSSKKLLLTVSIILNLSILFYFKYTDFLIGITNDLFGTSFNPLGLLLPIGISFYTFENISYTVDVYRGEFVPVKKFSEYLLFLSFFPKLVMGPIVRAADFIPQISKPYSVTQEDFAEGFYMIVSGLFKKLIISDYITQNFVNYIFDAPTRYTGLECLFAVYGYAIVIYCDFSGYSSIAIGIARWLGFKIPPNFNLPYKSKDITDFWRRWHISLSTWLRDYLYIPLGGNRKGKLRQYINLFITMLLGGLWHGANFSFIVWGGMHGLGLAIHKLWSEKSKSVLQEWQHNKVYNFFAMLLTFHFVCLCWVFFKSPSFTIAMQMLRQIKYHFSLNVWAGFWNNYHNVIYMILLGYALHCFPEKFTNNFSFRLQRLGVAGFAAVFIVFAIVYGYFKTSEPVLPIYLQF
jgi:D-alanyl-lipoteichoic acid acyltransferase DltB (MBOAT superfamily)